MGKCNKKKKDTAEKNNICYFSAMLYQQHIMLVYPTTWKYGEMMQQLWDQLEDIMSRQVNIEAIWIRSHCGIQKNDVADELARRGILESNLFDSVSNPAYNGGSTVHHKTHSQEQYSASSDTSRRINYIQKSGGGSTTLGHNKLQSADCCFPPRAQRG